ncbi:MAG: TetR/AcrR family transcriptional regulator [Chloroflexi bacterium]|nr:MAG: TetR/AcrR family transcriptional regulator [Chloroflexota bacterium]
MTQSTKNKTDRRIQRTRQFLRKALLELIKEKDYDTISIEEITERANVGRATFYLRYKDKEDLLLDEFREMANEKVQALSEIPFSAWLESRADAADPKENRPAPPLLIVFEHIHDNSELYYILLKSEKASRIVERIRKISTGAIVKFVETKAKTDPIPFLFRVPIEFFAAFFSGALLSTVDWWLEEGMHHTPREMTYLFQDLFIQGATNAISPPANMDADELRRVVTQKRSSEQPSKKRPV